MSHADNDRNEFYKNARYDLPGPLVGVRVLEVTTTWAGPRCGCILADYGADVVRVELAQVPDVTRRLPPYLPGTNPPDGFLHASANKNKRSIALDIRRPEGREVFMRMLPNFDVVLENFKKGTMTSWGCSYEDCCTVVPNIIYISITGFGQYGPYSERPGYDPAAQAYSGFMWLNRENEDQIPMRAPTFLADELAGLHGALSAVASIRHRERTGEGQHIDVSLLDAAMDSSTGLLVQAAAGIEPPIVGNPMTFAAPTNIFKCKDGFVYAGVLLDTHWKVMARMIGRPELADDPRYSSFFGRILQRADVDAILGEWCAQHTREEVVNICQEHQLAVAPVCSAMEAVNDPHVQVREAFSPVKTTEGEELFLNSPAPKMSRTPLKNRTTAPGLGQHTDELLEAAGIGEAERLQLREKGVIQ